MSLSRESDSLTREIPSRVFFATMLDFDMRGKIHLLKTVCIQLTNEVSQEHLALTKEEKEAVGSCIQELEEYVLSQSQQEDQAV